jgi:hypothetical protein
LPARYRQWLASVQLRQALAAFGDGLAVEGQAELAYLLQNAPEWRQRGRELGQEIGAWAWRKAAERGERDEASVLAWAELVCRHIPAELVSPAEIRRASLAYLYQGLAFAADRRRQRRHVRRYVWRAFGADRRALTNRGLWAILGRSLLRGRR